MSDIPESPEECPVCLRVEARIKSLDSLKGKLSETEIEHLITEVQNSVLKKNDITRGNKMSDEKIVLNKANFDELYEAQKYILLLVEKMANRMEKHDAILAAYGSQLADVMMKAEGEFGMEVGEAADDDGLGGGAPGGDNVTMECKVKEAEPVGPVGGGAGAGGMSPIAASMNKTPEFEAGYKAAMADSMKKNGVPTNANLPYPEFGNRAISAQDVRAGQASMEKSFSMKDLADMKPSELNAELKKRGLL